MAYKIKAWCTDCSWYSDAENDEEAIYCVGRDLRLHVNERRHHGVVVKKDGRRTTKDEVWYDWR